MPLRVRQSAQRTLGQRLALRIPALAGAYIRLIGRLAPGSRLRRALVSRYFRDGVEAVNRRDYDVVLLGVEPDYEVHPPREMVTAGFVASSYRGRDGYHAWVSTWQDVWGEDVRLEAAELIDLGDRAVLLAQIRARGQSSGIALSWEFASVSTFENGRAIRDDVYGDHRQALAAVGWRD
ncbi:MAG TPA: nuclear transport factor 2 family protein [Thermoleophilaceae bacterium]